LDAGVRNGAWRRQNQTQGRVDGSIVNPTSPADFAFGAAEMMHCDAIEATPIAHLEFSVRFADGVAERVKTLPSHLRGVFEPLKDPAFFARLTVCEGFVAWPGEIDLAPDAMHEAIREKGEWVLE
jgi:hypothetical protein